MPDEAIFYRYLFENIDSRKNFDKPELFQEYLRKNFPPEFQYAGYIVQEVRESRTGNGEPKWQAVCRVPEIFVQVNQDLDKISRIVDHYYVHRYRKPANGHNEIWEKFEY